MEQIFHIYQDFGMEIIGVLLLLFFVISCVQLHKINVIKKRMNGIADQVKNYLAYVMDGEDEQRESSEAASEDRREEDCRKQVREEEQNRLISAVLEEIFP